MVVVGLVITAALDCVVLTWCQHRVTTWLGWAIAWAPNHGHALKPAEDPDTGMRSGFGLRSLRVTTDPGISMSILILDPAEGAVPRGTVFAVHGIRDRKESQLGLGRRLASYGYRVILPDLRGHGQSSGEWLSYGVKDRRDLSRVLDTLAGYGFVAGPVGAVGHSYGASTILQWAGMDSRVRAVVAVAPFADLRSVVPDYIHRYLNGLYWLIPASTVSSGIEEAGRLGGFDPDEASPLRSIPRVQGAVLLIHGAADRHIPESHSFRLQQAALPGSKLIIVRHAGHYSINSKFGEVVRTEVREWFRKHLAQGEIHPEWPDQ